MHITQQKIMKGMLEDRVKLYLEDLLAKAQGATGTAKGKTDTGSTGAGSTGGDNTPAITNPAPAPAPTPTPTGSVTPLSSYTYEKPSSNVLVRGDERVEATETATEAGVDTWTDFLKDSGVSKDKVLTGLEAASYWEKYLASTAKSTPSGNTN
jgi:hypothetical protein